MLTQVLREATYCIIIRYTCKLLSPNFSLSHEFRSSNATPAKHNVNKNWRWVRVKEFVIRSWADEGGLISFPKYSSSNFSHVQPSGLPNSNLFNAAFWCLTQFRSFLDTPRSSFFRKFSNSFIVSRSIHQERVVFLVSPFSRGSIVICCPTLWCWLKCCMKQHTASSSGTRASFCPRTSVCHMKSDLPMQLQPSTTWTKTDAESEWRSLSSGVGQMRVASSRSRSTPAATSPTFNLVGSPTPTYSTLLSDAWPSFEAFWILRGPASLENSLILSSYPDLSTRNE